MPHSEIHKKKRKKNWMIFTLILLWCALIWAVTMIKVARADDDSFVEGRALHQAHIVKRQEKWQTDWDDKKEIRIKKGKKSTEQRAAHSDSILVQEQEQEQEQEKNE